MSETATGTGENADQENGRGSLTRIEAIIEDLRRLKSAELPDIFTAVAKIEPLTEELRVLVGKEISTVLNRFHGDRVGALEEKRRAARVVNDLVDTLGLRIKCAKTGLPTSLIGQTRSNG